MSMKKFINDPANLTRELLEGFAIAHADLVTIKSEKIVCRTVPKPANKVALVTLGGAGHEPALSGFVGEGMLDYSVVGDIFAAPGPPKVIEALRLAQREAGILFVVLNHAGDVMSANMAMEMADKEGIGYKMLLTHEDIAPGANAPAEDRRGLVGCHPALQDRRRRRRSGQEPRRSACAGQPLQRQMATLAVAMKTATHPASGQAIFELADDEMEIGMGQHGEAGTGPCKILTADQTAELMLVAAAPGHQGQGRRPAAAGPERQRRHDADGDCTSCCAAASKILESQGISLAAVHCGEWLTVQEMAGFQMCVAKMDDELLRYWKAPCNTPALTVR